MVCSCSTFLHSLLSSWRTMGRCSLLCKRHSARARLPMTSMIFWSGVLYRSPLDSGADRALRSVRIARDAWVFKQFACFSAVGCEVFQIMKFPEPKLPIARTSMHRTSPGKNDETVTVRGWDVPKLGKKDKPK